MCVAAIAWNADARWQLVLVANRDELHARASSPIHRWADPVHVIAGRDLVSGGSWLGVSDAGRIAVVTNLRGFGDPDPAKRSRGDLVTGFLAGQQKQGLDDYNPFNLFVADAAGAQFMSNRPEILERLLGPGLHSLSNGTPDLPWRRRIALERELTAWLDEDGESFEPLFAALRSTSDEAVEDGIFIEGPLYGTRCSTVIAIDQAGSGIIHERRFAANGAPDGETRLTFAWA